MFDLTILVKIEPGQQMERLMARNAVCREDAELRLANQMPIHNKIQLATIVIDNQCVMEETERKVAAVWEDLLAREKAKALQAED